MTYYRLGCQDEPSQKWLIHSQDEETGRIEVLQEYRSVTCSKCGRFDHDQVFEIGFAGLKGWKPRKQDTLLSTDEFYCVSQRFVEVVRQNRIRGIEFKQIGSSEWFVVSVTLRFKTRQDVFKVVRGPCKQCGWNIEMIGNPRELVDFAGLPTGECFFSMGDIPEWSGKGDRSIYATRGVVDTLKNAGLRKGVFLMLIDPETRREQAAAIAAGKRAKAPKDAEIFLK